MNDHEERRAAEAARAVQNLNQMLDTPAVREELKLKARWRKNMYDAHIAAGFNPGQALYLCTIN